MNPPEEYFKESPQGRCLARHVKRVFPEFYDVVSELPGDKFSEKLYRYYHPEKITCKICGKPVKFRDFNHGYAEFCSMECAQRDPDRIDKIAKTCEERYGVANPSQLDSVKAKKKDTMTEHYGSNFNNASKARETCLERYGDPHYNNRSKARETCEVHYGAPTFNNRVKSQETCLKRYGSPSFNNRSKARETCLERYGVGNVFELPEVFNRSLQSRIEGDAYQRVGLHNQSRAIERHDDVIDCKNGVYICECPHPDCDRCTEKRYSIEVGQYHGRKAIGAEMCTILQPIGKFCKNTSIETFVKRILDEIGIEYECNNRSILGGQELDIYIPSKKIAIECNGVFWHSEAFKKNRNYHRKKFEGCLKQGIQLLTIWEDQIIEHPDRITNMIRSKLGSYDKVFYGRCCEVRECTKREADTLLQNHIQGPGQASIRYGIYHNGELLSIMTFGKRRGCFGGSGTEREYELIRYCAKPNVRVVGGASKMLKRFIRDYKPNKIVSYSSNDISIGTLYESLGFEKVGSTDSYWYIDKKFRRYHRYTYRKSELVRKGLDSTKTERELTAELGLMRIWDSGQTRWELNPN